MSATLRWFTYSLGFVTIVGWVVVGLSSYMVHKAIRFQHLAVDDHMNFAINLGILVGFLVLQNVTMFLARCGLHRKTIWMLRTYGSFLVLFLVGEIVCSVLVGVKYRWLLSTMHDHMQQTFARYYNEKTEFQSSINWAQHSLGCCGVAGYRDWYSVANHPVGYTVTPGCCTRDPGVDSTQCYKNVWHLTDEERSRRIYTEGCFPVLQNILARYGLALGITVLISILFQVMAMILAYIITFPAKKQKYNAVPQGQQAHDTTAL